MNDTIYADTFTTAISPLMANMTLNITAHFAANDTTPVIPDSVTITFAVNDATMGSITPAGVHTYAVGDSVTVNATANAGYHLDGWHLEIPLLNVDTTVAADFPPFASTVNTVMNGATITAIFAADSMPVVDSVLTINVAVNDATMGTTNPAPGTYTYHMGETINMTAVPNDGYHVENIHAVVTYMGMTLIDSNMVLPNNTFTMPVAPNMLGFVIDVTVNFAADTTPVQPTYYTVTVNVNDETMGYVTGAGTYEENSTVTLVARANEGYRFVSWSNGVTDTVYTFTITSDVTLEATFERITGIDDVDGSAATIYAAESRIYVRNASQADVYVYDVNGRCIEQAAAVDNVEFTMANTGVFFVKVGNAAAKRVVVVR